MLELYDKDFKTFNIKVLQRAVLNRFEVNEKSLSKEIDDIKENQMEILSLVRFV